MLSTIIDKKTGEKKLCRAESEMVQYQSTNVQGAD
jgi:hypothetical protein